MTQIVLLAVHILHFVDTIYFLVEYYFYTARQPSPPPPIALPPPPPHGLNTLTSLLPGLGDIYTLITMVTVYTIPVMLNYISCAFSNYLIG